MTDAERRAAMRHERDEAAKLHEAHGRRPIKSSLQDLRRRRQRRRAAQKGRQLLAQLRADRR